MSIWQYADWIDFVPEHARVTLGEGNTPLVRSRRIGPQAGLTNLWFKLDFSNPTASYEDRFAAATVSHMVATSSGNTGASLAAYCAVAGIDCLIAVACRRVPPLTSCSPKGTTRSRRRYATDIRPRGR